MTDQTSSFSPSLDASLRFLDRLPEHERAAVEQAFRAQLEADQEEAQAQAARDAEEEEARALLEQQELEAEAERHAAALRDQEAHLAAAKNLIDLAKASEVPVEPKDKTKKVVQDNDLSNTLDLLVATPSQKVRDKIRANDYVDMWHLTAEGMAAATRSKLTGDTAFELGNDGTFKIKDSVLGFKADQDLSPAAWVTALGHYVRVMQAEGVDADIVESMVRLNHLLVNHPQFAQHSAAIRLWHQQQRRQWVLSGHLRPDGMRFNLGKPNPKHFDEIRLRLMEERAHGHTSGAYKRPAPDSAPASAPRVKVARSNFRCFVCASSESGHPFRTCAAKERVDGKEQHVVRGANGRVVFADSLKPICIDHQLKGCFGTCRAGGLHRCANCGAGGHGASTCSN
ncbi:hypothetical protein OC835_006979 [Tilletia horrida]|nr:hypothetical protein OC835_006979 [Tilletia horrida]